MTKKYMTPQGLKLHSERIKALEKELSDIQHKVGDATEKDGNSWHDNAHYDQLLQEIRVANRRLSDAHNDLGNNVEFIDYPKKVTQVVLGSNVNFLIDGEPRDYSIVAYGESDLEKGRILYETPLARALMGHKKGDRLSVHLGGRDKLIEIIEVGPYVVEGE